MDWDGSEPPAIGRQTRISMRGGKMNVNDCSAIVTGAASGLGAATAEALAKAGARLALFDLNKEAVMTVASKVGGTGSLFNHHFTQIAPYS